MAGADDKRTLLLSTPVESTHYLIDMLLSRLVALAAIAMLQRMMTQIEPIGTGAVAPAPARR